MATAYTDQASLEIFLGGAAVLRQLTDPGQLGIIDSARVTDALEGGAAEVRSWTEIRHDPETLANLSADSQRLLKDMNTAFSCRRLYQSGGLGLAMPEQIAEKSRWADELGRDLAEGRRRLGRAATQAGATLNQLVGVIDHDVGGHGISIDGFKRGFR